MIPQVKINTFDTPQKLDAFIDELGGVRMFGEIGDTARALIEMRTLAGNDVDGNPFVAYSTKPMYAPVTKRPPGYPMPAGGDVTQAGTFFGKKTEGGHTMYFPGGYQQYKAGLGRGSTPNLSVSNQMLSDIRVNPEAEKVVLDFATAESAAKAHGHHYGTVVPRREFFNIKTNQDLNALEDELVDYMVAAAARAAVPLKGSH